MKVHGIRPRRLHPYVVWRWFIRLQSVSRLRGEGDGFFSPLDIGSVAFSNWHELTTREQEHVTLLRINFAVSFLCHYCRITEKVDRALNPCGWDRYYKPTIDVPCGVYKPRPPLFADYGRFGMDSILTEYESMDAAWGRWINRRGAYGV